MTRSLQLLKSGFLGFSSHSSQEQSSSQESKNPQSELKKRILSRLSEALNQAPGPQKKLILSLVGPALDTTTNEELLGYARRAYDEFGAILMEFDGDGRSRLASNQDAPE
jgi:hypothetical protein